jgi:sugar/nucleoside kinase (ribokinase family)
MAQVGCAGILVKDTFCGPLPAVPRPGELVAVDALRTKAGGCAANVAIDLRKQNLTVDLVGCVGRDAAGEILAQGLREAQVNCDQLVYTTEYPTSETIILLVAGEDRRYMHAFGANQAFTVQHIHRDWVAELDVLYIGGLFAMPRIMTDELMKLLAFSREHNAVTVVDVVLPTDFKRAAEMEELIPYVDWFVPNDAEAAVLTGQVDPLDAIRVFRSWGAHNVVVTLGDRGAVGLSGNELWHCDAYSWQTVDPSGAGDAFASGLITGIVKGWDFSRSLVYASVLGASATRAIGTTDGVLTSDQAEQVIAEHAVTVSRTPFPKPVAR